MIGYAYPDFLLKDSSYPSPTILGILYRKGVQFKRDNRNIFKEGNADERMNPFIEVIIKKIS